MNTPINGQKTVAVAATAEKVISTNEFGYIIIKALAGNTNNVYVGDSGVTSANGFVLAAEESVAVAMDGLNEVYIDVDTNGEGVSFFGVIERN